MIEIAEAKEKIFKIMKEKPGQTTEEIAEATGLSWDATVFYLGGLCRNKAVKCIPKSHTKEGIRAEYFPI